MTDDVDQQPEATAPGIDGATGMPRRGPLGRLYHGETAIDFYGKRWIGLGISAALLLVSLGSLILRELNLSIDFKGGVVWEVPSNTLSESQARSILDDNGLNGANAKVQILQNRDTGLRTVRVQVSAAEIPSDGAATSTSEATSTSAATSTTDATSTAVADSTAATESTAPLTSDSATAATDSVPIVTDSPTTLPTNATATDLVRVKVQKAFADKVGVAEDDVTTSSVSSTWGSTITRKAIVALFVFLALVALFIAWRLEWHMALAAIIAMLHDVLLSVGVYSLLGFEVTPATVVAFLTILGFSLYDTIVVFDKVKENQARYAASRLPYADVINVSMNQVLMRSLNTSLAAVLPVLSLLVLGAGVLGAVTLRHFALALLVGLITGSYSSIYVASPLVAMAKEREPKYRPLRGRHATGVELERLVLGGSPSARREGVKHRRTEEAAPMPTAVTPEEVLTHSPRPRKKKRRG